MPPPESFTEHDITVGSGPTRRAGTMTLPRRGGPHPGVVLLTAGPFDRDLTTGPNKPFKDLAWGLASRGVAVARFDKVSHVHRQVAAQPGFTMVEEYVPHAVAAVRLLQQQPGVDPARVFVLGHSGGGKAAPRVAAAEASVAGLVILAGDTLPLPRAIVRVSNYLAELDPVPPRPPPSSHSTDRPRSSKTPACQRRPRPRNCSSAGRPRTGWTYAVTSPSRPRQRWTSRCSSCRAAATTR